jgi:hypothetical protein
MGKLDIAPYEAEIDKLCASCVADIAKECKRFFTAINDRVKDLSKKIIDVPIPDGLDEKELKSIPDRIDKILTDDSTNLKDLAEPQLMFDIDVKKRNLKSRGTGLGGSVVDFSL